MANEKEKLITDEVSEEIVAVAERIARTDGVKNITVRRILKEMSVTNRVFYNRYHNINEVLEIIYRKAVIRMRESLQSQYDMRTQFYDYVMDVAVKVLVKTYEVKSAFSQYMFEFDSSTDSNRIWWTDSIKKIIEVAKETGQLIDVDSDMLSYTIWCFFRGYNADAVKRKLSVEEAVSRFKFGLHCLFYGLSTNK
ncbi:MAG: TetR/AcrR family transcriptional regulator [Oscillospiraceae bacterium]|nr:TetR/AcrR family transcriptional regulator [Oscillospiraceae bacterium]